ncbi:MAG: DUF1876 family protein [Acidimicrobiia bacterium]|jgi:hypothetical protein
MSLTIPVMIELDQDATEVGASATLELPTTQFTAEARASVTRSASTPITDELAIARVLRDLEVQIMRTVHERIDRYVADE